MAAPRPAPPRLPFSAALILGCLLPACGGSASPESPADPGGAALFDYPAAGEVEGPAPPAPPIPAAAPTVAFLGDSICAGLHLPADVAFPAVLQRRLAAEGLPFHLVSACESGRTSAGGAAAVDWVMRSEPDVVVIGQERSPPRLGVQRVLPGQA